MLAVRVELSLRGDYAVRAMLALAAHRGNGWLSAPLIAERMAIPVRFLPHVLTDLSRAGLVIGRPGRTGGYRLAIPAEQINLLGVVEAVEGPAVPSRCVLRGGPCGRDGRCAVHEAFADATTTVRAELQRWNLAELSRRGGLPTPA
jgi:Rrf2 family transcriptional regulator, iron-sulfur cluster assembly transcription factor